MVKAIAFVAADQYRAADMSFEPKIICFESIIMMMIMMMMIVSGERDQVENI